MRSRRAIDRALERRTRGTLSRRALALAVLSLAGGVASCGTVEPVAPFAPVTDPTQLYMALTLDHPAVTLSTVAPYHTIQLTATPRDGLGQPMEGLPTPTYTSSDTANVTVTADGMVTARGTASGVTVIARLAVGPVSHVDTAVINVTNLAAPPKLASLSIQPVPPDSAVISLLDQGSNFFTNLLIPLTAGILPHPLTPGVVDSAGNAVTGLPFTYTSLDPSIASVVPRDGYIGGVRPGQVRLVAQTTAYGITLADTVVYTVTPPLGFDIQIAPTGVPGFWIYLAGSSGDAFVQSKEIHIASHGIVLWYNYDPEPVDVTFDDTTNVAQPTAVLCDALVAFGLACDGSGNTIVPGIIDGDVVPTFRLRQFPVPGIYSFHSARLGPGMRIVVGN